LTAVLEGKHRPGHFRGVCQVVAKLFNIIRPEIAVFGQKDYQQFRVLSALTAALDFPTELVMAPTLRDPDGLALSSRNRFLSAEQRTAALALSQALGEGAAQTDTQRVLEAAGKILADEPGIQVDYLALTDPLLGPAPTDGPARLLVAAKVGTTRLIDNVPVLLGDAA
jgi:pantoate--beta-alanine ligase